MTSRQSQRLTLLSGGRLILSLAAGLFILSSGVSEAFAVQACIGNGVDGVRTISGNTTWDAPRAKVSAINSSTNLTLTGLTGTGYGGTFATGDEVLILQVVHSTVSKAGLYEFGRVSSYGGGTLVLEKPLINYSDYAAGANDRLQVVLVPNHTSFTVNGGITLTAPNWDDATGGVIAFRATGTVTVSGTITASGAPTGGAGGFHASLGVSNGQNGSSSGSGGGGGGGHASAGGSAGGAGGAACGVSDLSRLTMGGGGNTSGNCCCPPSGGGIVAIMADTISVTGGITANGGVGQNGYGACGPCPCGGPGGGAGGAIALEAKTDLTMGASKVTASAGSGGTNDSTGGAGSVGRIAVVSYGSMSGSTSPAYNTYAPRTCLYTPTVLNVSSSKANGAYTTGENISVQVQFSEAVVVSGSPQITLSVGSSYAVNYSSGSGGSTLTFGYTVQAGHNSSDLDYASTSALTLNGGTINAQATGNTPADLTLAAPGAVGSLAFNKNIVVDTTAPTVAIAQASGQVDPATTTPVFYTVTFSEPVTGFTESDVSFAGTATINAHQVIGSGTTFVLQVRPATGQTNKTVTVNQIPAASAVDLAGNPNTISASSLSNREVTYNDTSTCN